MDQGGQGERSSGALSLSGANAQGVGECRGDVEAVERPSGKERGDPGGQGGEPGSPISPEILATRDPLAESPPALLSSGISGRSRKRVKPSQWATRLFIALRQGGKREEERASIFASRFMSANRSTRAVRFLIQSSDSFPRRSRVRMRQIQGAPKVSSYD